MPLSVDDFSNAVKTPTASHWKRPKTVNLPYSLLGSDLEPRPFVYRRSPTTKENWVRPRGQSCGLWSSNRLGWQLSSYKSAVTLPNSCQKTDSSGAPNDNFRKNICSEHDLRCRIFRRLVVKFLACLPLLGFSNI